jgi:hypothetical protein
MSKFKKSFKCDECGRIARHTAIMLHGMKVCDSCAALAEQVDNFKATGGFDADSVLGHLVKIARGGGQIDAYADIKALALYQNMGVAL